ncbi:MAG: threonine/serine exporter family protein [Mycobacterium sp.]|nr:threonine/serine exporter family protein [Mycobacterium sp.]
MTVGLRYRAERALASLRKDLPGALTEPDHDDAEVAAMLRELGIALVEVDQPTQMVAARLIAIAERYTDQNVRVVALPRVLFIQVGSVGYEVDTSTRVTTQLDAAAVIDDIAELAELGAIRPADAIERLAQARCMKPRFGPVLTILGYAVTTLGFGMLINPHWSALGVYAVLGAAVGAIMQLGRPVPALHAVLPTAAAAVVAVLAGQIVGGGGYDVLLRLIAPALVPVLPGIPLTLGAMELAGSSLVAGASRLVYGVVQLMLVVFGVGLGMHFARGGAVMAPGVPLGGWAFYAAIVVIGVGLYLHLSAPPGSLVWLIAAVGVALVGQKVGGIFLSSVHAGAIGAFLVVPFASLASRVKTAPPAIVLMLAAFSALVPSTLSFESLGEAVSGTPQDIATLGVMFAAIFSIALGTLIGWSLFHPGSRHAARNPR